VTLPAGKATSRATPIRLVATRAGEDRLRAVSSIGSAEQVVRFLPALPTAVAVAVSPAEIISDGRTSATVSVQLVDVHKHLSKADGDVEVYLTTNLGQLKAASVVIAKGKSSASTTISSNQRGPATIQADAAGLDEGKGSVSFTLPIVLGLLATLGGVLGAFIRSGAPSNTRRRRIVENFAIGAATGVVFWLILLFGALRAASTVLPFDPTVVPAANEAGALLLGTGGGWLGRLLFGGKR